MDHFAIQKLTSSRWAGGAGRGGRSGDHGLLRTGGRALTFFCLQKRAKTTFAQFFYFAADSGGAAQQAREQMAGGTRMLHLGWGRGGERTRCQTDDNGEMTMASCEEGNL